MLRARSGMTGVMVRGSFHVWRGEGPNGVFPTITNASPA